MFGISLEEFLLIIIIGVLVIGPKDFPEIARNIIKGLAKAKSVVDKAKVELSLFGKEIGIEDIKNEVAIEMANEKAKIEQEITTIIDIYGDEHQISSLGEIRKDKSKDEIDMEIFECNQANRKNTNLPQ